MKRFTVMLVALITVCCMAPAFAVSGITPTEETWYVVSHSDDYRVYYYAVVGNLSDSPVSVNDLLFEIQDRDGMIVDSTSKYKMYPEVLNPGQSGYLVITKDLKDIKNKAYIDHYNLTIISKVNDDKTTKPLTASAEYLKKDEDDDENVIRTAVVNAGADNVFGIQVAMAVRDSDNKLLYVASGDSKDIGLASGNALLMKSVIRSDIVDELEDANIQVASAEAIAYSVEDVDD